MMKELILEAEVKNLPRVQEMIAAELEALGAGTVVKGRVEIAVEEIFVNICSYAYAPGTGRAAIQVSSTADPACVKIRFADSGKPYNPLERPAPDLKIPLQERKKGGLGIHLVKKMMDDVSYAYSDGQNILTLTKMITP